MDGWKEGRRKEMKERGKHERQEGKKDGKMDRRTE